MRRVLSVIAKTNGSYFYLYGLVRELGRDSYIVPMTHVPMRACG